MSEGALLGPKALEQIRQLIRDERARYQNPEGHRARWTQGQPSQVVELANTDPVYTLAIRGSASAGTITVEVFDGTWTSITVNYDDDVSDIETAIAAIDAGVQVRGGDLRWNAIKIHLSDATYLMRITASSLTRETNGVVPKAELSYCPEPSNWWS